MKKKMQSAWQNLITFGKSILAHVSIGYDGSKGSFHIDIIPADPTEVIADCEQTSTGQTADIKALPDGVTASCQDEKKGCSPDDEEANSALSDSSSSIRTLDGGES